MGKFLIFCWFWIKFGTRARLKPSDDWDEFELDRARSKNNVAENSCTLGHKMHNSEFKPASTHSILNPTVV